MDLAVFLWKDLECPVLGVLLTGVQLTRPAISHQSICPRQQQCKATKMSGISEGDLDFFLKEC